MRGSRAKKLDKGTVRLRNLEITHYQTDEKGTIRAIGARKMKKAVKEAYKRAKRDQ